MFSERRNINEILIISKITIGVTQGELYLHLTDSLSVWVGIALVNESMLDNLPHYIQQRIKKW